MNPARVSGLVWMSAAAFLLVAGGLAACEAPAPIDRGRLAITFAAAAEFRRALVVGEGQDALDVQRLELKLREVKFLPGEAPEGGEAPGRVQESGDFTIDVLDPANSDFEVEVDPGLYKKVEMKVARPMEGQGIDGTDAALWIEGSRDGVTFRFVDDEMMKLTFRDVDLDVPAGGVETLVVDLDVPRWLQDVDLAALEANEDGLVEITENGPNSAAHRRIESNISDAIRAARHPGR